MRNRKVITDFIKAFSCSYSMTRNLGQVLGQPEDPLLLQAVLGFGSGVATMGDTCGAANGGCAVLGRRFGDLPDAVFYPLCGEFFLRLEKRRGLPNCGRVHGGKHLAGNLRRAILTGKPLQCMGILRQAAEILRELDTEVEKGDFPGQRDFSSLNEILRHFSEHHFHCCQSTLQELAGDDDSRIAPVQSASRGFCGGMGLNGTLCGAISGGVFWLGLTEGVDLRHSGYRDGLQTVWGGLIKSEAVFADEKWFPPARLFRRCQQVYQAVEQRFGGAHCRDILGLRLDTAEGARRYIAENKLDRCRAVIQTVAATVAAGEDQG